MSEPASKGTIRILVVDDHPVIRKGLRQMLDQERDFAVCGEAGTTAEAMAAIRADEPDLAIIDVSLGDEDGLDLVKAISTRWPSIYLLVLSMYGEKVYAERAIRAGAHGYVMKHEPPETLIRAIRRVSDGLAHVSDALQQEWLGRMRGGRVSSATPMESLTDREITIFRLIGQGYGTREIADRLHLSAKTVESYKAQLKEKLGLRTATELLQQATLWVHAQPEP